MKPKVLFIASELTPVAKVGGLGDVAGALPYELRKQGIDVRVMIPRYQQIKKNNLILIEKNIPIHFGRVREKISLYQKPIHATPVFYIDNGTYLSRGPIYGDTSAFVSTTGEAKRFLFFSQCVVCLLPHLKWQPDIIHCQDWHTSLVPVLLKINKLPQKTLLTIHNLANQGSFNQKQILSFLGTNPKNIVDKKTRTNLSTKDKGRNMNLFQQGILSADLLSTVSETYAKEILTRALGSGLEGSTQKRKKDLYGIVNGIDVSRFNPAKDPDIIAKYSLQNVHKQKQRNKTALLKEMKLYPPPGRGRLEGVNKPLFGLVSRLTSQKGIDLIARAIPTIIKNGGQFVYLGEGTRELEGMLGAMKKKYPDSVAGKIAFDAELAQRIYAGADIFLMPSRFEPCGLGQMISMRYGTVPLVRSTGGLRDTVKSGKTGFVFTKYTQKEMNKTVLKAIHTYKDKKRWNRLQKNGMLRDSSWKQSATKYLKLYKKLT